MKTRKLAAVALAFGISLAMPAIADHHEMDAAPHFSPVEIWPCSFKDGKGMGDLNKTIKKWNGLMDAKGDTSYSAWLLMPNFINGSSFDVGWVGIWPNAEAMGAGLEAGLAADSQAMTNEFFNTVECAQHAQFASMAMQAPSDTVPSKAVIRFSDCTISEGTDPVEAMDALRAWVAHQQESGSVTGHFVWWPAFGEDPDADYSFKLVSANSDYMAFASDWDAYMKGGWKKYAETVGDTFSCDTGRVYDAKPVRLAQPAE